MKKFAAGSRQLLLTISVKAIAKEAKNPYAMKVSPERQLGSTCWCHGCGGFTQPRIFVGYISSGGFPEH